MARPRHQKSHSVGLRWDPRISTSTMFPGLLCCCSEDHTLRTTHVDESGNIVLQGILYQVVLKGWRGGKKGHKRWATLAPLRALRSLKRFGFAKQLHTEAACVLSNRFAVGHMVITPYRSNHSLLSGSSISLIAVYQVSRADFCMRLS